MSSLETPTALVVTMRAADFSGHNYVSDTELSSLYAFSSLILQDPHDGDAIIWCHQMGILILQMRS